MKSLNKIYNKPQASKKEKANAQGLEAAKEGDESDGHRINKPGDHTLEVHILVTGGLFNSIR